MNKNLQAGQRLCEIIPNEEEKKISKDVKTKQTQRTSTSATRLNNYGHMNKINLQNKGTTKVEAKLS